MPYKIPPRSICRKIKARFKAGATRKELAKEFNYSYRHICTILVAIGIPPHSNIDINHSNSGRALKIPKKLYPEIKAKCEKGIRTADLAVEYNCSAGTINNIIRRAGGAKRKLGNKRLKRFHQEIKAKFESGMSPKEIAKEYNCAHNTINNILRKMGIRQRISKIPREEYPKIKAKFENGATRAELGAEYNCGSLTISALLRRAGVPGGVGNLTYADGRKRHPDKHKKLHAKIIADYLEIRSMTRVAAKNNISMRVTQRIVKTYMEPFKDLPKCTSCHYYSKEQTYGGSKTPNSCKKKKIGVRGNYISCPLWKKATQKKKKDKGLVIKRFVEYKGETTTKVGKLRSKQKEILRLYTEEYLSVRELAKKYKVSVPIMYQALKEMKISFGFEGPRYLSSKKLELNICKDYLDSRDARAVGKKYNIPHHVVLRVVRAYGIFTCEQHKQSFRRNKH
jgi:Mor family transcriptional regulator